MSQSLYILLGLVAGVFGGMFGLGGGVILIPAMVYIFGLTQHQAQGTNLVVMLPPIGLLAAWQYYYHGNVKLGMVGFICAGFFVGGLIGALVVHKIPDIMLRRLFGVILMFIAAKMILGK